MTSKHDNRVFCTGATERFGGLDSSVPGWCKVAQLRGVVNLQTIRGSTYQPTYGLSIEGTHIRLGTVVS